MNENRVTKKESISYMLYFFGQNIFYLLTYMYLNTYFTDVGIPAAMVGIIVLIVKIWDAVNDPIFGGIVDKVHMKGGKFVPWLRIAIYVILITNIFLFSIPMNISSGAKIAWAIVAYCLWSVGYTMNDVPIFGLITTITDNQEDRVKLNASGRVSALLAAMIVAVVIPLVRGALGGWMVTVIILSVIGFVFMLPIGFTAKERVAVAENEENVGFKDMISYLFSNKYLLIYYVAFMISGALNIGNAWGLYIARHCLGNESMQSLVALVGILPTIIIGIFVPKILKKIDKFKLYYISIILTLALTIVRWLVGYNNVVVFMIAAVAQAIPLGISSIVCYMFTPDCAEYGRFKTGKNCPGITFATQTFFAKLQSAVLSAVAAFALTFTGFIEGEGATQVEGFSDKLFSASCIIPIIGFALAAIILAFYKLNDKDVEIMTKCNNGEITREEAESQLSRKY